MAACAVSLTAHIKKNKLLYLFYSERTTTHNYKFRRSYKTKKILKNRIDFEWLWGKHPERKRVWSPLYWRSVRRFVNNKASKSYMNFRVQNPLLTELQLALTAFFLINLWTIYWTSKWNKLIQWYYFTRVWTVFAPAADVWLSY